MEDAVISFDRHIFQPHHLCCRNAFKVQLMEMEQEMVMEQGPGLVLGHKKESWSGVSGLAFSHGLLFAVVDVTIQAKSRLNQ